MMIVLGGSVGAVFVEVALKGTLLMAAAGLATLALRGATASLRHMLWSFILVAMLAFPALMLVLPRWQVGLFPSAIAQDPVAVPNPVDYSAQIDLPGPAIQQPSRAATTVQAPAQITTSPSAVAPESFIDSFTLLWIGGVAAGLITIIGGILTLRGLASRSTEIDDPEWIALLTEVATGLGVTRKVRLVASHTSAMPATWGIFNPVVLLPAGLNEWSAERRRVVLLHELAHVKRNDCLTQIISQLCCAVYWFHPGVWYTAGRVRAERELACDEHVLGVGVNACDYASHLVEIARLCRVPSATPIGAVAMARPSQLEGRLQVILEERSVSRWVRSTRMRRLTVAGLGVLALPLAAMNPWTESEMELRSSSPSPSPTIAPADTFRWKGVVPRGKWLEVMASYGDLRAELSKDGQVEVIAIRKNGNADAVRVAYDNKDGQSRFCAVRAAAVSSLKACSTTETGELANGINDVRVDFLVRVPAGVGISLHTDRGNIAADEVNSYVWGTSGRGDISITTTDLAEASTRVGSISAEFGRRTWKQDLEFYTDNGDVTVVAPSNANMLIQAETGAGQIRSDFDMEKRPFGGGQRSVASVGSGGGMLTLRTGKGIVELKRGRPAVAEVSDMTVQNSNAPVGSQDPKPNPNPDPGFDPNPNLNPDVTDNDNPTGELVPVEIPGNLIEQFSDARISGWPEAAQIARLRNIAAGHVKQHEADLVRERAEWALTLVREGQIVSPLREALTNRDWRVRAYAAWALGETRDPRVADILTGALSDEHWRVRMHAAGGLDRIAGPRAIESLIKALSDDYWQVRISAVDALASTGDRRVLPSLRAVAERDPRWIVRDQAVNAIQRIK